MMAASPHGTGAAKRLRSDVSVDVEGPTTSVDCLSPAPKRSRSAAIKREKKVAEATAESVCTVQARTKDVGESQAMVRGLRTDGFAPLDASPDYIESAKRIVCPFLAGRKHEGVRTGRTILSVSGSTLSKTALRALLPPALVSALHACMTTPALVGIQSIVAPPHSPEQEIHRDIDLHAGLLLTWVLALDGAPLRTRFDAGSHLEEHRIIFRSSDRAASLATRSARMVTPGFSSVLYDGFIMHAGGANPTSTPDDQRLFFVFVDASMDAVDLAHAKESNYFRANTKHLNV